MTINVPADFEEFVRNAVGSGAFRSPEDVIRRALELLERQQVAEAKPRQERQGGQWRGQVKIAEDFDALPADLQAAFGMRDE